MIFCSFVLRHLCPEHEVNAHTGITTLFTNMWTLHFKTRVMESIHSRGEDLCKFIGTKEVFLHKYGHRSVMWIHSIVFTIAFSAAVSHNYDHKQGILKHRNTQTGSKSTNHKSQTMTFWTHLSKVFSHEVR